MHFEAMVYTFKSMNNVYIVRIGCFLSRICSFIFRFDFDFLPSVSCDISSVVVGDDAVKSHCRGLSRCFVYSDGWSAKSRCSSAFQIHKIKAPDTLLSIARCSFVIYSCQCR